MTEPAPVRDPDEQGFVERDGVRVAWQRFGDGEPTLVLLPAWSIVPSRVWKAQVPYLARHFRVVTFDGRGSGASDRPRVAAAYSYREFVADALAVMDASATDRAVLGAFSRGAQWALPLAAEHGERVLGAAFVASLLPLTPWPPLETVMRTFEEPSAARRALASAAALRISLPLLARSATMRHFARRINFFEGVTKYNVHYWRRDYRGFLEWFVGSLAGSEAHSTRQIETGMEWGLQTDPETLADAWRGERLAPDEARRLCAQVRCPVRVVHGTHDLNCPLEWAQELARLTGGRLLELEGGDHLIAVRRPVAVNLALRQLVEEVAPEAPVAGRALGP